MLFQPLPCHSEPATSSTVGAAGAERKCPRPETVTAAPTFKKKNDGKHFMSRFLGIISRQWSTKMKKLDDEGAGWENSENMQEQDRKTEGKR